MGDNPNNKGLRHAQHRQGNTVDNLLLEVSDTYSAADLVTTRAGATWGSPVDVRARDRVYLFVTFTKVSGQTGLTIAVQVSPYKSGSTAEWFDRRGNAGAREGGATALETAVQDLILDVSGLADGVHRMTAPVDAVGNFMRFKPFGAGTVADSRCTIGVVRDQLSS